MPRNGCPIVVRLGWAGTANGIGPHGAVRGVGVRSGIAEKIGGPDSIRRAYDVAAAIALAAWR
jgi:hypothetical protein